ncbi:MAG: DNA polymerase [Candidatus Acetothermia bacterium]|nr:DNA polymerase [Candidatus Acetothermia bacterium]MDH7504726.1 DNA polymerase [Candidatus Acetothermia bacterium]
MTEKPEKRLLLIDAGSIVYPAYHVMRELATSSGFPTGAIYGFARTLLKLLHDYPSEYMAVAFDSRGKTVRHERYEEYKATRPLMDEALAVQLPKIKELLEAWAIPSFAKEGYEADDIIATLAKLAAEQGLPVLIVSGDKDLMQLVDEQVWVLKPARPPRQEVELLDRAGVKEHLGVPPELVRDYLALVGDKVDNVPGVPGVGEKTAQKLLEEFGSLERVLENAAKVGNARVRESLLKHRELALLSRELVGLREVELELGPEPLLACRPGPRDEARLRQLLEELEFRSILKELGLAQKATSEGRYHTILTEAEFKGLLDRLAAAEEFALDLETTSQDSMQAEIVGIALAFEPYEGFYIPVGHDYLGAPGQLGREYVLEKLKPFLEDERKGVLGQNLKYDAKVLRRYGIRLRRIAFDSMIAAYLLDPTSRKDLGELAARYLKRELTSYKELSDQDMRKVPVEEATRYAGEDAEIVLRLRDLMVQELKEKGLYQLFTEVELPLIEVLVEMELAGVLMDPKILEEQAKGIEVLLDNLRREIFHLAGEEFNLASPKQVAAILYEKLKLPVIKKTKTGPSTDSLVLKELALQHPLPEKIVTYRELEKLLNTYIRKLPEYINPRTGRVHTSFNQSVTATGRLSCLPAGTLVNTQEGLVGIEQVRPGDLVRTPFGPRQVLAWQMTGKKPVICLTLSNGITLRCSPEHRFRSRGHWVRADELSPGMPLYMSFTPGLFGAKTSLELKRTAAYRTRKSPALPRAWTPQLAELVGYCLADGHIARSNYNGKPAKLVLAFGWDEEPLMDHFARIIQETFGKAPRRRLTRSCPVLEVSGVDIAGAFAQLGLGRRSREARVPQGIFHAPEEIVAGFLRGYFEGDGSVSDQIMVRSSSRALLEDVQQLLAVFGVPTAITGGSADPRGYAPRWTLRIVGDRSKQIFYQRINFISMRKRRACRALLAKDSPKSRTELLTLPTSFTIEALKPYIYDAHRSPQGKPPEAVYQFTSKMAQGRRTMTLSRAEWLVQALARQGIAPERAPFLHEATSGGYYEVTVRDISYELPTLMYDIAVEGEQYMAQGILVHNSSDPNLQNIPVRTELGGQIRRAFIAPKGRKLLAADYSQIELRMLAHLSGDENLIRAFHEEEDLHTRTAAELFEVPKDKVTKAQREIAKRVNYATIYGVSAFRLSKELGIPQKEAQQYLNKYFERYPRVKEFIEEKIREAEERGYATTILNRRRYLPHITSRDHNLRSYDQRNAINTPIQGSSADLVKLAMLRVYEKIKAGELKADLLLQIHDELLFELDAGEVERAAPIIKETMEQVMALRVPLKVEIKVGENWEEI